MGDGPEHHGSASPRPPGRPVLSVVILAKGSHNERHRCRYEIGEHPAIGSSSPTGPSGVEQLRQGRGRATTRGVVVLEPVFVTPVVFVLVLGIVEIGLVMSDNLVRAHVRTASADMSPMRIWRGPRGAWHHHPQMRRRGGAVRTRAGRRRRSERGVAIVELALVILPLTLVVFTAIDLGRLAQYQNRVTNSAREGVATLGVHPGWVTSGCGQDRNAVDRARNQNLDIASMPSYTVKAYKGAGPFTPANEITGCTDGFPTGVVAGSKVSVVVSVRVSNNSPLSAPFIGSTTVIERSATATVQG